MTRSVMILAIVGAQIGASAAEDLPKPDRGALTSIAVTAVTNRFTDLAESDLYIKMIGYGYEPTATATQEYFLVIFRILGTKTVKESERSTITTEDQIDVEIRPDGTVPRESVTRSTRTDEDFQDNLRNKTSIKSRGSK